jgi:hypothetical protein
MSPTLVPAAPPIRLPSQNEIVWALVQGWKIIIISVLAFVAWAANNLHSESPMYEAQIQVTAAEQGGGGTPAGGGLAAAAAILNLNGPSVSQGNDFRLYQDSYSSRDLADELAKNATFMHTIFAGEWNETTQTWQEPELSSKQAWEKWFKDLLGFPEVPWHAPDGEDMLAFLTQSVQVEVDPRRPYIAKIVCTYYDPKFALQFLAAAHHAADDALRRKALKRANDNIAFLNDRLAKVTLAEHRTALAAALSEQEQNAMMAQSNSAYAADLFEQPWANSYPVFPRPVRELLTSTALGIFVGGALAVLQWMALRWYRSRRPRLRTA